MKVLRKDDIRFEAVNLHECKQVIGNSDASLVDLGDGVACLVFHSKGNALTAAMNDMICRSMEKVETDFAGLVIANEGKNFSVGANLHEFIQAIKSGNYDQLETMIRDVQHMFLTMKYLDKPVVCAPHQKTLGGGAELCLAADQLVFDAETQIGLVETGIGLIPGGGGCKEMAVRASRQYADPQIDLMPAIQQAFETIFMAKVSPDAAGAERLGFVRSHDFVVEEPSYRIGAAKQAVLALHQAGYRAPGKEPVRVAGDSGRAALMTAIYGMKIGGFITDYDAFIAEKVAYVLTGGDAAPGMLVTEEYLLDIEREAFMSLIREQKTQERIQALMTTGQRLRN